MDKSLPSFKNAKILVVGDLMLDRYWYGASSRISPEAPVQVVNVGQTVEKAGGAGNVATNITSLGSSATLIAVTGDDNEAKQLHTQLTAANVQCDFEQVADLNTITKLRVVSRKQQLIRLDFEQALKGRGLDGLKRRMQEQIKKVELVVLSDYAKGALKDVQSLIQIAVQNKRPVLVDPKGSDFEAYQGATLVTPNINEFEAVVGSCDDEQQLVKKGNRLLKKHAWQALLITRGEQGMTLLREGEAELHLPAMAQEVFDVTGAGDTVIATLASALAAGSKIEEAVVLANIAAGIVVAKLGTATVSHYELGRQLRLLSSRGSGVMSEQQLVMVVEEAKAHGEKIVMTNGCFDILHAGHVSYLEQAKELGDRLIVAVNSDGSVKKLKGEGRPINPCNRRMSVLAGLGSVDWVVEFNQTTPQALVARILPDWLVKGGDYPVEEISGAQEVLANGGKVETLGFIEGLSTSQMIDHFQQP